MSLGPILRRIWISLVMAFLSAEHISKTFPGVKALDDVSVEFEKGSIHALMGENGAGKSTLGKIIAGVYTPDKGVIKLDGQEVKPTDPRIAQELGLAIVFGVRLPRALTAAFIEQALKASEGVAGLSAAIRGLIAARTAVMTAVAAIDADMRRMARASKASAAG